MHGRESCRCFQFHRRVCVNAIPHAPPLYLLAGGRSSRFGDNKARALWRGQPLIAALAKSLAPSVKSITVVAATADAYADLGFRTIADLAPGQGPLGGLQAALHDNTTDAWLVVVACDWAGERPEWVGLLLDAATADTQCVCFGNPDPEPLFALYHISARAQVDQRIKADTRAMRGLVCDLRHRILPPPPGWDKAVNVNHQEDLTALNEQA